MNINVKNADFSDCYIEKGVEIYDTTDLTLKTAQNFSKTRCVGWYFGTAITFKGLTIPLTAAVGGDSDAIFRFIKVIKSTREITYLSDEITISNEATSLTYTDEVSIAATEVFGIIITSGGSTNSQISTAAYDSVTNLWLNVAYIDSNLVVGGYLNTTNSTIDAYTTHTMVGVVRYKT